MTSPSLHELDQTGFASIFGTARGDSPYQSKLRQQQDTREHINHETYQARVALETALEALQVRLKELERHEELTKVKVVFLQPYPATLPSPSRLSFTKSREDRKRDKLLISLSSLQQRLQDQQQEVRRMINESQRALQNLG
jgi:galactokinase